MKIAVLNAEFHPVPPALGGPIAQTLYETALSYPAGEMVVISPWTEALENWAYDASLFRHIRICTSPGAVGIDPETGLPPHAGQYLRAAADIIEAISPDLIQIHNAPHFLPYLSARFPEITVVLFAHNPLRCDKTELNAIGQNADCVVFVSDYLRHQFLDEHPEARVRTEVIYNAVDTSRFSPDRCLEPEAVTIRRTYDLPGDATLLFSGRPLEQKGLEPLIRCMKQVRRRIPRARLLVAGTPAYKREHDASDSFFRDMRQLARTQRDAVRFAGYIEPGKMPWFYGAASIAVVPSLWGEPFGKSAAEAMATGVPVIASRRGGLPEIITHGRDGLLVDNPENETELAETIVNLLADRKQQKRIAQAGLQTVHKRFSLGARQEALASFYNSLSGIEPDARKTRSCQHPGARDIQMKLLAAAVGPEPAV